jgi:hypothetical protein
MLFGDQGPRLGWGMGIGSGFVSPIKSFPRLREPQRKSLEWCRHERAVGQGKGIGIKVSNHSRLIAFHDHFLTHKLVFVVSSAMSAVNMVPFPRLHFFMTDYAPLTTCRSTNLHR